MNKKTLETLTNRMSTLTDSFSKLNDSVSKLDFGGVVGNMLKASMQIQNQVQGGGGTVAPAAPVAATPQNNPSFSVDNFFKKPLLALLESFSGALDLMGVDQAVTEEGRNKLADNILAGIGPALITGAGYSIVTTLVPQAINAIITEFYSVMKSVTELQTKALATGLKEADILGKFGVGADELRSSIIDMEGELLKLREIGIRELNGETTKLADRMLFTNQNVGVLGKFLTSNALAVGLNTEQAQSLAQKIIESTAGYGASQQAILEAANSIQEISTKVNALAGTGPELTRAMATYTASFGVENADMLKNALGFMFDTQNQTFIRAFGFTDQVNKVLAGQATPEELLTLIQQMSDRLGSIAPKLLDVTQTGLVENALKAYGLSPERRQTFDTLAGTKLLEPVEDIYDSTLVFKDAINGVVNETTKLAKGLMTGVENIFGGTNQDWKEFRKPITNFFKSVSEMLDTYYLKVGVDKVKEYFSVSPDSGFGKFLDGAKGVFDTLVDPIKGQFQNPESNKLMKHLVGLFGPNTSDADRIIWRDIADQLVKLNVTSEDLRDNMDVRNCARDRFVTHPKNRRSP